MCVPSSLPSGALCLCCGVHTHHCSFPFARCVIHWLSHVWWLPVFMALCCLVECGISRQTVTHKHSNTQTRNTTAHRRGCVACFVCDSVVRCVRVRRSVVAWWIERGEKEGVKDTVNKTKKSHKSHQPLSLPFFFFSLFSFPPLSKLSFLSSLKHVAYLCGLYEETNMHNMCLIRAYPQIIQLQSNTTPF